MRKSISNQTWVITGISSGIGLELTKQLLKSGSTVIGIVRNKEGFSELSSSYVDRLKIYEADLRHFEEVETVTRTIFSENRIDVVVSNAGICLHKRVEDACVSDITSVINTNLIGAMVFLKSCVEGLKSEGGKIIQIGSISSQVASAGWAYYCASKFGIAGFCEALAEETKEYNISVMIVEPGNVNTSLWKKLRDDTLKDYSEKADISVKKLARRIISMSLCEKIPLYLPMGSKASHRIIQSLQKRLVEHKLVDSFAKDVDEIKQKPKIGCPSQIDGRDIYFWPLGEETRGISLYYDWKEIDKYLKGYLDVDTQKVGSYFCGRLVQEPHVICGRSKEAYIIVGSEKKYSEIKDILETFGFKENEDFCFWRELIVKDE